MYKDMLIYSTRHCLEPAETVYFYTCESRAKASPSLSRSLPPSQRSQKIEPVWPLGHGALWPPGTKIKMSLCKAEILWFDYGGVYIVPPIGVVFVKYKATKLVEVVI